MSFFLALEIIIIVIIWLLWILFIELHLHKDGLNVTNDCSLDLQDLVCMHQDGRPDFLKSFIGFYCVGDLGPKQSHKSI